jgi:hypothetical protein
MAGSREDLGRFSRASGHPQPNSSALSLLTAEVCRLVPEVTWQDTERLLERLVLKNLSYCLTAIAEISTFAPPIKPATRTAARAGLGSGMIALYTSFILGTSFRSVR